MCVSVCVSVCVCVCARCNAQDLDFTAENSAALVRTLRVARITAQEDETNRKLMLEHLKMCRWKDIIRLLEDGVTVESETADVSGVLCCQLLALHWCYETSHLASRTTLSTLPSLGPYRCHHCRGA